METIQTERGLCFTPNRFRTLCGIRLDPEIPLTFSRVIERTHWVFCNTCHKRWEHMNINEATLISRIETDECVWEHHNTG